MRLDRVALKEEAQLLRAVDIQIVANQPIQGFFKLFPSDHFGLLTTFELRKLGQTGQGKRKH